MSEYIARPTRLQLELSSMCNALCPGCARTESASFNVKRSAIPDKKILSLVTLEKIFNEFETVTTLEFCGTVDDPYMHPFFNEVLQLAYKSGIKKVLIHTNGSIRSSAYWIQSAEILQHFRYHEIKFSIDGLADTNHLYRQNTNFNKILENSQAFIGAGGNASWQYLLFPWNEHQVNEAKNLAQELGFANFVIRTDRSNIKNITLEDIKNRKKKNNPPLPNKSNFDELSYYSKYADLENDLIECFFREKEMYFIDFNARLWPCCFLRNTEFFTQDAWKQIENNVYNIYDDPTWNRLDLHTVSEILNHPFYKNNLVESFSNHYGTTCSGKLVKCAKTCGTKSQPISKHKSERL